MKSRQNFLQIYVSASMYLREDIDIVIGTFYFFGFCVKFAAHSQNPSHRCHDIVI